MRDSLGQKASTNVKGGIYSSGINDAPFYITGISPYNGHSYALHVTQSGLMLYDNTVGQTVWTK